jgi:hypothetical protein
MVKMDNLRALRKIYRQQKERYTMMIKKEKESGEISPQINKTAIVMAKLLQEIEYIESQRKAAK